MKKCKSTGSVYTPHFIVTNMLDFGNYYGQNIIEKHIIDNSCGDGAFLTEIVNRYCVEFLKVNTNKKQLAADLSTYIHGIEIDPIEHKKCIDNLNKIATKFDINDQINWDIINANTLTISSFDNKMDFVFGNPPYVRVHNLAQNRQNTRRYSFCQNGMTDLYIVFFEIGFQMLNDGGKMCLITPSSWLSSKAAEVLRRYISLNENLHSVIDLEHFQAFKATTYTIISLFIKGERTQSIEYYSYDSVNNTNQLNSRLSYNQISINNEFYLGNSEQLTFLKTVMLSDDITKKYVTVKNGFATLADGIFINDKQFSLNIDVIKASTGKWYKCIFPYNNSGNSIDWTQISEDKLLSNYLSEHKESLSERSLDTHTQWYLFGRSQGIKDVFKPKISINTLIKNKESLKIFEINAGQGVYSGLYILTDIPFDQIKSLLEHQDFFDYVKLLRKYKSGGYYTFNSKDVERYLNYHLLKSKHPKQYEQPKYTQASLSFI